MDTLSPVSQVSTPAAASVAPENVPTAEPPRKKQKRNKPTLSCDECVERKTKCDRGRPNCLACIKRQTECRYRYVANILEATQRAMSSTRRITRPPKKAEATALTHTAPGASPPAVDEPGPTVARPSSARPRAPFSANGLLAHIPYTHPSASNVFGIGSEHPFANYWTWQGGLPEVISVLPEKFQADFLLERYFECVDPVYPMVHRQTFFADYEHFWSQKDQTEGDQVALLFAMLALGTQFVSNAEAKARQQMAEFYVSAAHQSLRLFSYLNKTSMRSIQAMVLVTYFLINDNHASDGWAFAGILIRQAYAMGLHRDPDIICPEATFLEKQQRRKLWQAVLLQDTFLTVLLTLPPSATHTDVSVDSLMDSPASIGPENPTDVMYIRGCWHLANLVQEAVCSPRSLDLPICTSPRQKSKLLADFRSVYRSFPDMFRSWTAESLQETCQTNPRFVRQVLFLTSNYFHNVMLVHSSECKEPPPITTTTSRPLPPVATSPSNGTPSTSAASPGGPSAAAATSPSSVVAGPGAASSGVQKNIRGTLEAAHDAMNAFFLLHQMFPSDARVWWVFSHRAFLEGLCMAEILRDARRDDGGSGSVKDPAFAKARADIMQMIDILSSWTDDHHSCEVARTRVQVLSEYLK